MKRAKKNLPPMNDNLQMITKILSLLSAMLKKLKLLFFREKGYLKFFGKNEFYLRLKI